MDEMAQLVIVGADIDIKHIAGNNLIKHIMIHKLLSNRRKVEKQQKQGRHSLNQVHLAFYHHLPIVILVFWK